MTVTEEYAKGLWCPMVRGMWTRQEFPESDVSGVNRTDMQFNCIGSGCMLWEWEVDNPNYPGPEKYHDRLSIPGVVPYEE